MAITKEEKKRWKKLNASAKNELDINEYVSPHYFELLGNLEGNDEYPPIGGKLVKGKWTTHFGVTQDGIESLKEFTSKYDMKVPNWILDANVRKIDKEKARIITEYVTAFEAEKTNSKLQNRNLMKISEPMREAALSIFHMLPVNNFYKSYDDMLPGSILRAIDHMNEAEIAKTALEHADGKFIGEYVNEDGSLNSDIKRFAIPAIKRISPDYVHNKDEAFDLENKLRQSGYVFGLHENNKKEADNANEIRLGLALLNDEEQTAIEQGSELYGDKQVEKQEPTKSVSEKPVGSSLEEGWEQIKSGAKQLLTDFTNWHKKLLNNDEPITLQRNNKNNQVFEEDTIRLAPQKQQMEGENVTGNTNINMQQGVTPVGGSTNK